MRRKGKGFYILVGGAALIAMLVVGRVLAGGSGGGSQTAIDTTGTSKSTAQPSEAASQQPTAKTSQQPKAKSAQQQTSKGPMVVVNGKRYTLPQGPTILLNPGLVRAGGKVAVTGFGFTAGTSVDLSVKQNETDHGLDVTSAKTDPNGSFNVGMNLPKDVGAGSFIVTATPRNGSRSAEMAGAVAAGVGSVKVSPAVGKPGDSVTASLQGFKGGEDVAVFFNGLGGDPVATIHADSAGSVARASFHVPVGAVGNNVFLFSGVKSHTLAISQYYLLALYPGLDLGSYATRAANQLNFSGKGFAPKEPVLIFLNNPGGTPIGTVQTEPDGSFSGVGFTLPYTVKGKQTLIAIGDQSRASVSATFQILPYSPNAEPSTYAGGPGTTLSFYANGFAPDEVVLVYINRSSGGGGKLVTAFRVDGKGNAAAAGQYMIPGDAQGKVVLTLIGRLSGAVTTATVAVQKTDQAVQTPPQPDYVLPPDLQQDLPNQVAPNASGTPSPAPSASGSPRSAGSPAASPRATSGVVEDPYQPTAAHVPAPAHPSFLAAALAALGRLWNSLTGGH